MGAIKLRDVNPVVFNYKVGIGESSPNEALVVVGTSRFEGTPTSSGGTNFIAPTLSLKSTGNTSNWAGFSWKDKDDNFLWSLTNDLDNQNRTNELSLRAAHGTLPDGTGTRVFTILADGKTGWGIDSPQKHFHIGGSLGGVIQLTNDNIGNAAGDGTIMGSSAADKYFYIDNREAAAGIGLRIQGYTGYWLDQNQDTVLGGGPTGSTAGGSRFTVYKSGLAHETLQKMLMLYGKYSLTSLDYKEGVSIGVKLEDSNQASTMKDAIKFVVGSGTWPNSNIDTLINNDGGSVLIGTGVGQAADTNLMVRSSVSAEAVKLRLFATNADAYLSFGDNATNFYAGIDTTYGSFNIAHGSGTPGSSTGGIVIWPITSNVGIGTGATAPANTLTIAGGTSITSGGSVSPESSDGLHLMFDTASNTSWIRSEKQMHSNRTLKFLASEYHFTTGNLGIGAHSGSPGSRLHVIDSITEVARFENITASSPVWIRLQNADGFAQIGTRAGTIELAPSGGVTATFQADGKIKVGTGKKAPIRHWRDDTENTTALPICTPGDAANADAKIIYSKELLDIREDDILIVNTNWGIAGSDSIAYNPHIYFGLLLADEPTSGFTTTEGSNYVRIMSDKVTHMFDSAMGESSYGSRATGTYTSGTIYNNLGDIQAEKAFDTVLTTYCGMTGTPNFIQVDLGSGVTKVARKIRILPVLNNAPHDDYGGWGGVKTYTFHGSNDGSAWTQLANGVGANDENWEENEFANSTGYRYFKIVFTDSHLGQYPAVAELEILEAVATTGGVIFPQEQLASAMYKITAADVNASRNCVNFIVWAKHGDAAASCADGITLASNGQLDVLQIHGAISD